MEFALTAITRKHEAASQRNPSWTIGSAFVAGALLEVSLHPKPGLVTPRSNGAHADMGLQTFMVSTAAIAPGFYRCAEAGYGHAGGIETLLPEVRAIGREYEELLLASTRGVNTQRGLLFSGGILCAAAGWLSRSQAEISTTRLFNAAAAMTAGLCTRELGGADGRSPATAGEYLHERFGVRGIRGEVEDGFPTVALAGLPAFEAAREAGAPLDTVLLHTLISLMAVTEDTTVLWRGGRTALDFVRTKARAALDLGGALTEAGVNAIRRLDDECIARNISPGGSADLLAVTVGVHALVEGDLTFLGTFDPTRSLPDAADHLA